MAVNHSHTILRCWVGVQVATADFPWGDAVLLVGPDAGRVHHDVRDVRLLVHAVKQVRHGTACVDSHLLPSMRLAIQGHARVLKEFLGGCREENILLGTHRTG